ncbi:integrase [Buttiauxella gaviniae ATCC 51604]|uniref:Integrase n=1 Tax=Buttiauxella gaviniae ATCC 51604 TaxID=1354253 RepID=A0A1B7HRA7_9ENTR|nr:tyrosine-type recombinase/integrase [Buttiauxella gaviniae]MRT15294.1 tyrosine-type recombinase/integrase [Enterobacteriaceae bacterium RIT711]OAT18178.1 integrase [Buttiauxella gaviniae ATCC 51604]
MSVKKLDDGRYEVDVRPAGRKGKRVRRKFIKRSEALAYEKYILTSQHEKEWLPRPVDNRSMSTLRDEWWRIRGRVTEHGLSYQGKINRFILLMGDLCAFQINSEVITRYRVERIASGIKASTVNRELYTLCGMFTCLKESGIFSDENPFRGYKRLKTENTGMSFLSTGEITRLLGMLEGDNYRLATLCLSTGARWGEARSLRREHIIHNRVHFLKTKTGQARVVPVSADAVTSIVHGDLPSGLLFPSANYNLFRSILKTAKPDLPRGQASHVLRHTFATHFMINGGNIITLQRILGHARIEQTMAYAHFAPEYLQDAIAFNPLRGKLSPPEKGECPHNVHTPASD